VVRKAGLEPARVLPTTPSRWRVYQIPPLPHDITLFTPHLTSFQGGGRDVAGLWRMISRSRGKNGRGQALITSFRIVPVQVLLAGKPLLPEGPGSLRLPFAAGLRWTSLPS
jgi:hypothetical protein